MAVAQSFRRKYNEIIRKLKEVNSNLDLVTLGENGVCQGLSWMYVLYVKNEWGTDKFFSDLEAINELTSAEVQTIAYWLQSYPNEPEGMTEKLDTVTKQKIETFLRIATLMETVQTAQKAVGKFATQVGVKYEKAHVLGGTEADILAGLTAALQGEKEGMFRVSFFRHAMIIHVRSNSRGETQYAYYDPNNKERPRWVSTIPQLCAYVIGGMHRIVPDPAVAKTEPVALAVVKIREVKPDDPFELSLPKPGESFERFFNLSAPISLKVKACCDKLDELLKYYQEGNFPRWDFIRESMRVIKLLPSEETPPSMQLFHQKLKQDFSTIQPPYMTSHTTIRDREGFSPLYYAARFNHISGVRSLLAAGAVPLEKERNRVVAKADICPAVQQLILNAPARKNIVVVTPIPPPASPVAIPVVAQIPKDLEPSAFPGVRVQPPVLEVVRPVVLPPVSSTYSLRKLEDLSKEFYEKLIRHLSGSEKRNVAALLKNDWKPLLFLANPRCNHPARAEIISELLFYCGGVLDLLGKGSLSVAKFPAQFFIAWRLVADFSRGFFVSISTFPEAQQKELFLAFVRQRGMGEVAEILKRTGSTFDEFKTALHLLPELEGKRLLSKLDAKCFQTWQKQEGFSLGRTITELPVYARLPVIHALDSHIVCPESGATAQSAAIKQFEDYLNPGWLDRLLNRNNLYKKEASLLIQEMKNCKTGEECLKILEKAERTIPEVSKKGTYADRIRFAKQLFQSQPKEDLRAPLIRARPLLS